MRLQFADTCLDLVVLHLIVAVVACPSLALNEAQRVTRSGGHILVLDKFLRPRARRAPSPDDEPHGRQDRDAARCRV